MSPVDFLYVVHSSKSCVVFGFCTCNASVLEGVNVLPIKFFFTLCLLSCFCFCPWCAQVQEAWDNYKTAQEKAAAQESELQVNMLNFCIFNAYLAALLIAPVSAGPVMFRCPAAFKPLI